MPKASSRRLYAMKAAIAYHSCREARYALGKVTPFLRDADEDIADHATSLAMHYMAKAAFYEALRRNYIQRLA